MVAKMEIIVGDVTGLQQRHRPSNIPHLVKKIKGFPLKVKLFRNTATKTPGRGSIHPAPLVPRGRVMHLRVRPRVNSADYLSMVI